MLGQVPPTGLDVNFTVFRIPIRVHPVFWVTAAWLSWVPGRLDMVFVGILCILVAILVHELGHALVTRRFGWNPEVVLYFLGGYATSMRHKTTWRNIAVMAAGPGAGLLLGLVVWISASMAGVLASGSTPIRPVPDPEGFRGWNLQAAELTWHAVYFSLWINFLWSLVNLLPVLPLDGGQISRELWCHYRRDGLKLSLTLSTAAAAAVAIWSFYSVGLNRKAFDGPVPNISTVLGLEPLFLGLMFAFLGYQSYQSLEAVKRGYGNW